MEEKISDDLKKAMKAGGVFEVNVLRLLLAALHNKSIEKKGKSKDPVLTDDEVIEVIQKEAKKRKEAIIFYGSRPDLLAKEEQELKVIENYLPAPLSEKEVAEIVTEIIAKTGARGEKDFGKVMGLAMKEIKGRAEAAIVSRFVKEKLG